MVYKKTCPKCGATITYFDTDRVAICSSCNEHYNVSTDYSVEQNTETKSEKIDVIIKDYPECPACNYKSLMVGETYSICRHCGSKIALDGTIISRPIETEYSRPQVSNNVEEDINKKPSKEGSLGGFLLGFFLGFVGLVIGLICGGNVKNGSLKGFLTSLIISIIVIVIFFIFTLTIV